MLNKSLMSKNFEPALYVQNWLTEYVPEAYFLKKLMRATLVPTVTLIYPSWMEESTPILFQFISMVKYITLEPLRGLIFIQWVKNILQSQEELLMDTWNIFWILKINNQIISIGELKITYRHNNWSQECP